MLIRIDDSGEFRERVHVLFSVDIEEMGLPIVPDTALGYFFPASMQRLAEFCLRHPKLHIVSWHGRLAANTSVLGSSTYLLADGCRDPRLVFDPDGEIASPTYRSLYAAFNNCAPNLKRST